MARFGFFYMCFFGAVAACNGSATAFGPDMARLDCTNGVDGVNSASNCTVTGGANGSGGSSSGNVRRLDGYSQWVQTSWSTSSSFFKLYAAQDRVFARTWDSLNGGRLFLTVDNGANWPQVSATDSDIDVLSVVESNNAILGGTWNGLYRSASDGLVWDALSPAGLPPDTAIRSLSMLDSTLFAGTTGNIFKSLDNGNTWAEVNSGIPFDATITSIVASGDTIFATSDESGIFITRDGGTRWNAVNSGLIDTHIFQLASVGTKLFAVTLSGAFVSENSGTQWSPDSASLGIINCLLVVDNQLLAGTDDTGVYLSIDGGATWTPFDSGMPDGSRVWSLAAGSDSLFAGTDSGVWRVAFAGG